jgi:DNA primase
LMENLKEFTKADLKTSTKSLSKNKVTKGQVIEYYIRMAPKLLPIIADRPLV